MSGDGAPVNRPFRVRLARRRITIEVAADQTILEALMAHDVDVESLCREGICGTCETRVLAGTPEHRDRLLSDDERASGGTMMVCVSRALTDELELDL